jgi:prolyl-tRNA editing enzyme YbaK/EbsC (Cys-tRNA(Pro) deacylase)
LSASVQGVIDVARRKGVELEIVTFPESTHTAVDAARAVGAEVGQIVKSLVFVSDGDEGREGCMALVSGANTVDLARLAAVLGEMRLRRATADEARALTGFPIGGIPPFAHVSSLRTVMDPDLGRYEVVAQHSLQGRAGHPAHAGQRDCCAAGPRRSPPGAGAGDPGHGPGRLRRAGRPAQRRTWSEQRKRRPARGLTTVAR